MMICFLFFRNLIYLFSIFLVLLLTKGDKLRLLQGLN